MNTENLAQAVVKALREENERVRKMAEKRERDEALKRHEQEDVDRLRARMRQDREHRDHHFAAGIAEHYLTLRRHGVPEPAAERLTIAYQRSILSVGGATQ